MSRVRGCGSARTAGAKVKRRRAGFMVDENRSSRVSNGGGVCAVLVFCRETSNAGVCGLCRGRVGEATEGSAAGRFARRSMNRMMVVLVL